MRTIWFSPWQHAPAHPALFKTCQSNKLPTKGREQYGLKQGPNTAEPLWTVPPVQLQLCWENPALQEFKRKPCSARVQNELQVAALWVSNCSVINSRYRSHHSLSGRILRPSGKELQQTLSQPEFMIWSFNSWLQKWLALDSFIQTVLIPEYGFWKRQTGTQLSTSSKLSVAALLKCFLLTISLKKRKKKSVSFQHEQGEEPAIKADKRIM